MAATVVPQREIIRFEAGRPETVCLKYAPKVYALCMPFGCSVST